MNDAIGTLMTFALTGGVVFASWHYVRQYQATMKFHAARQAENPIFCTTSFECKCAITTIAGGTRRYRPCMLSIKEDGIHLYPLSNRLDQEIVIPRDSIRWFGRPVKYHDHRNDLHIHVEQDGEWQLVQLRIWRYPLEQIIRALKTIVPPELVTAYRRHRPYIHLGPVKALPAEQDIHGAWTLSDPVSLYVMPLYVVLLHGDQVLRRLPLDQLTQIAALRRLDNPQADGLVSLTLNGERLAFALKDYEAVAAAISEAAKRSLEEPIMQKQKKKDDDEDWD